MADKTIFQKIIDREIPADIVHEDDQCLAFRDIHPAAPTHILVVPKKPLAMIQDMTSQDEALVGHLVFIATRLATKASLTNGYRLVINNGADAGQSVFHLHLHLLGGRGLDWPPG